MYDGKDEVELAIFRLLESVKDEARLPAVGEAAVGTLLGDRLVGEGKWYLKFAALAADLKEGVSKEAQVVEAAVRVGLGAAPD